MHIREKLQPGSRFMPAVNSRSKSPRGGTKEEFKPRPSVTLPLFRAPEDYRRFRRMLFNIFAVKDRLNDMIRDLARAFDLTAPQHTIMTAVADLQGRKGVTVMALATYMRVSSPFIAAQTKGLATKGLMTKEPDPQDQRHTLLRLTTAGEDYIEMVTDVVQAANDRMFRSLDADSLTAFEAILQNLVRDADDANEVVHEMLASQTAKNRERT